MNTPTVPPEPDRPVGAAVDEPDAAQPESEPTVAVSVDAHGRYRVERVPGDRV